MQRGSAIAYSNMQSPQTWWNFRKVSTYISTLHDKKRYMIHSLEILLSFDYCSEYQQFKSSGGGLNSNNIQRIAIKNTISSANYSKSCTHFEESYEHNIQFICYRSPSLNYEAKSLASQPLWQNFDKQKVRLIYNSRARICKL